MIQNEDLKNVASNLTGFENLSGFYHFHIFVKIYSFLSYIMLLKDITLHKLNSNTLITDN
jgi:hypothetical protein